GSRDGLTFLKRRIRNKAIRACVHRFAMPEAISLPRGVAGLHGRFKMAKSQSRIRRTKETSGTRGRSNTNKTSSRSSSNRRNAARVADNSAGQMQSQIPSDGMPQRDGRARSSKHRSGVSSKKNQTRGKTTA